MVLNGESFKENPIHAGVPQSFIFGSTLLLLYIDYLPDDVICNIVIYLDDLLSTLSAIRHLICSNN